MIDDVIDQDLSLSLALTLIEEVESKYEEEKHESKATTFISTVEQ
jgi:hypothetical protein